MGREKVEVRMMYPASNYRSNGRFVESSAMPLYPEMAPVTTNDQNSRDSDFRDPCADC
jgi:hypothetical protein